MFTSRVAILCFVVSLAIAPAILPARGILAQNGPARNETAAPRAADFLPADVIAAMVLSDGGGQVDAFRALLDRLDFYRSPAYRNLLRNPDTAKARLILEGLAANAGSEPWEAVANLIGDDLAIGVVARPGARKPDVLLAVKTRDPALTREVLEAIHNLAGLPSAAQAIARTPARPAKLDDIPVFEPKPGICHAVLHDTVLVGTRRAVLEQGLRAFLAGRNRFTDSTTWTEAQQTVPRTAIAWAFLDVARLRPALTAQGKWPERLSQPFGGFLVGGLWGHLGTADRAMVWAERSADALTLHGHVQTTEPLAESHRGFVVQPVAARWNARAIPDYLGQVLVTRGWADLFAEREALFDLRGSGALAKFVTNVNTLFGGLDLVSDLLPDLEGATRLVMAGEPVPAGEALPSPRLPSFALVAPLREGAEATLGRRLEKAVQMGFSLLNLNALQKGEATYLLQTERYRDQRLLTTSYDEVPENPGVRFNFRPSAAVVRDHLIIATTAPMLKHVVNAILDGPATASAAVQDRVDLRIPAVAAALRQNRGELVAEQMLKKDVSRRRAAREIDGLLGLLDLFERASLESRSTPRRTDLSFRVRLKSTGPATAKRRPATAERKKL